MKLPLIREVTLVVGVGVLLLSRASAADLAKPLTPSEERATFRLADDALKIELVAAEPDVVSPVAITFDAEGRLFVAEMIDYPNGDASGRVRLLEDLDRDGRYEKATVFAENLPFPNGVLPWKGGVLITAAPDIWYCKDTDGDGRADERRVLWTGFGLGNQQLRVNGLLWGLDNWVYGANGRSEGEIRRPNDSKITSIRGHDFRFRPDTGEFEAIAGRSQFGLGRDDWGNRYLSWNTIAIRQEVLPERYLIRNPHLASTESVADLTEKGDTGRVYPLAPPPLTFNNESVKNFNALAGLTIFRGDALGEKYRGNAFVGESLLNLAHRRVLEPNGVTFVARRAEQEKEFLASTDPWFHPVNFATGPDGTLYMVDFYRQFVEHPEWVRGAARTEVPWRTGAEHGRIWRISPAGTPRRKANLSSATTLELVQHLGDENGWWRDTAQRLLVERQAQAAVPALERLSCEAPSPLARLHALHTLDGLHELKASLLLQAVQDQHPGVRRHAIQLSESFLRQSGNDSLRSAVLMRAQDRDAGVRFQTALSLGEFSGGANVDAWTKIARRDFADRWHALALLSSVGSRAWPFLRELLKAEPRWLTLPGSPQAKFLDQAAQLVGASYHEMDLKECLALLTQAPVSALQAGKLSLLAGLADGLAQTPHPLRTLLIEPPDALKDELAALPALIPLAAARATDPGETTPHRVEATRILARMTPELSGPTVLALLEPRQPAEVQSAAARALAELESEILAATVFARWNQYAAATRRRLLSVAPRSKAMATALAVALEQSLLAAVELDAPVRESLLKTPHRDLKSRLQKLLATTITTDRQELVARFQPALNMTGERRRGAAIFAKSCLLCHTVEGQGRQVGPDLSGIASRPKDALLVDILDPSRQVSPDYINYTLLTTDGRSVSGFIAAETGASVTLRRASEPDDTILRHQIKELRAEGKSLMPEGLEQGLTPQDLADLLAFLQKPEGKLLLEVTDQ